MVAGLVVVAGWFGCTVAQEGEPVVAEPATAAADLVLRGGTVYTADAAGTRAEAVAVAKGRIVFVGETAAVGRWIGAETRVIELGGGMVLPGFVDSHVHPLTGGVELGQCDLNDLDSEAAIRTAITTYAREHPDRPWIVGGGWALPVFVDANPNRSVLDGLVADRPVFLTAADGHSAWVNSRALEIAGITRDTEDPPPDGRIERDADTGEATGTLRESAMDLVARHIPPTTDGERLEGLRRGVAMANRFGITSVVEASADEAMLKAYRELERSGGLSLRVVASLKTHPTRGPEQVDELVRLRDAYASPRLRADAAKIFVDGVIESHTAALLEPYLEPKTGELGSDRGRLNLTPEALTALVTRLDAEGFQVHVHAIGDRAVRATLDAHAAAQKTNGRRDARHHMAHIQLIDPADVPRFHSLGIVANFQPLWAYPDSYIRELTEPFLGPKRSRWLYPIGSVVASGATVVAGSDWSVSSMNPLDGIQVAVTRQAVNPPRREPWLPDERVDLATILAAYTANGAYLARREKDVGTLEVGKLADLVVLDRDLFRLPVAQLHAVKVRMTLLEGEVVYPADE